MKSYMTAAAALVCMAAPALADGHASGDAAAGEKAFKQCKACHSVAVDKDNVIVKGGRNGPNLYGVVGRTAGTADGFKGYSKGMIAAGEGGLAWDEASFVEFVQDPTKYLRAVTEDSKARSKMTFKGRKVEDITNIWAYLDSVGPES